MQLTAVAVQTVADIERDPHWQARQLTRRRAGQRRRHRADAQRRAAAVGNARACIQWTGGALGQDNQRVYHDLGVSCEEIKQLSSGGVI